MRVVDVPELEGVALAELTLQVLANGDVVPDDAVPAGAAERLARTISAELAPPWTARVVRRGLAEWTVAARQTELELIQLGDADGASEISVARAPGGDLTVLVDGEEHDLDAALARAAGELERLGSERYEAFVARAVAVTGGWILTIDPL